MSPLQTIRFPFLQQRLHSTLTTASRRVQNDLMRPAGSARAVMPTLCRRLVGAGASCFRYRGRRVEPCISFPTGNYLSSLSSLSSNISSTVERSKSLLGRSLSATAVPAVATDLPSAFPVDSALGVSQIQQSQQYVAVAKTPKLKPYIVRRRLARMKVYTGSEKNIRHSPWRLNLVCQLASGLPLTDALTQLQFCDKWAAPLVQRVLQRTANLADIRDGLQPSQLEVAECFATRGTPLKRMKPMGRGRTGRMEHRHSHMRAVLREIDFKLKVYQAPTLNQKKRWLELQAVAQRDGDRAQAEREEIRRLEKQQAEAAAKASPSASATTKK